MLYVALRRSTSAVQPIFIGHVDSPMGPWKLLTAKVVPTAAGAPSTYAEDPFLYRTARGWHILTRRASKGVDRASKDDSEASASGVTGGVHDPKSCPSACKVPGGCFSPCYVGEPACGGGHLYSADLATWYFGEAAYHCALNISLSTSRTALGATTRHDLGAQHLDGVGDGVELVTLTSRERPTVFSDSSDNSQYLFTGASVNYTMYYHSFTLVQQIRTTKS